MMTTPIPIVKVVLLAKGEGPNRQDLVFEGTAHHHAVDRANIELTTWARDISHLGYSKIDYRLEYADGAEQGGRYDLVKGEGASLLRPLREWLEILAFGHFPVHMSERQKATHRQMFPDEGGAVLAAKLFVARYEYTPEQVRESRNKPTNPS